MTNSKMIEIGCKLSNFPLIMEAFLLIVQYIWR